MQSVARPILSIGQTEIGAARERVAQAGTLDGTETGFAFVHRLTNKHTGWTPEYTKRVIEEYRKFLVLAALYRGVVHLVPSDDVDEVWHEHMLFSEPYTAFCNAVCGEYLHHYPSVGVQDSERASRDYERTLALYAETLGEVPPCDIWPSAEVRFSPGERRINIKVRDFVIIERRYLVMIAKFLGSIGLLALFALLALSLLGAQAHAQAFEDAAPPGDTVQYFIYVGLALFAVLCLASSLLLKRAAQVPVQVTLRACMHGYAPGGLPEAGCATGCSIGGCGI